MTADEMVEQALGRLGEFTSYYPTSRGILYRRVGYRQRQLYAMAAKWNPERFGVCAISALQTVAGSRVIDLADITGTNAPFLETLQKVAISDKGTSAYASGDEVKIVGVNDTEVEFAPRALIRDGILIGISTDLDLVTSLAFYYSKLPALLGLGDKTVALDLVAPWDTLLEVDLLRFLVAKAPSISAENRAAALAAIDAEEKPLLADFERHVVEYTPLVSRFTRPHVQAKG